LAVDDQDAKVELELKISALHQWPGGEEAVRILVGE
jgi:hypothetical protein